MQALKQPGTAKDPESGLARSDISIGAMLTWINKTVIGSKAIATFTSQSGKVETLEMKGSANDSTAVITDQSRGGTEEFTPSCQIPRH